MTSRERLLSVLNKEKPDRVPISTYELVGYNSHAFENKEPSYKKLMDYIREFTDCICMWNPSSNETLFGSSYSIEQEQTVAQEGNKTIRTTITHTPKGDLRQITAHIKEVYTTWKTEHWCKDLKDIEKMLSIPYSPVSYDASDYPRIKSEVGENGIIMASLRDPLLMAAELMELGDYTVWAMTETDSFTAVIEQMHRRNMTNLENMLRCQVVDLYRICGPEYATPPFLPPKMFEQFVVPYVTEMVDLIHNYGAKARLHCHGRIGQVLDLIVSTGADGIDPCESPPDGDISLGEVKQQVGNQLCIYGNLQLKLLETGSRKEVESAVKECMEAAKAGGGYVIMPTAAPINVPLSPKTKDNYVRFIDTALEYGDY